MKASNSVEKLAKKKDIQKGACTAKRKGRFIRRDQRKKERVAKIRQVRYQAFER